MAIRELLFGVDDVDPAPKKRISMARGSRGGEMSNANDPDGDGTPALKREADDGGNRPSPAKKPKTVRSTTRDLPKSNLVIGLDEGMTGSAFAFAEENTNPENVMSEKRYPGCTENRSKVPSVICYQAENQDHETFEDPDAPPSKFGFEVPLSTNHHSLYKTSLDVAAPTTEYDDPAMDSQVSAGLLQASGGPTGRKAVQDSLGHLRQIALQRLTEELGEGVLAKYNIKVVLAHPAAMSDEGRRNLRDAAMGAGWQHNGKHSIVMTSESEAACLAAFISNRKKFGTRAWLDVFKKKTGVLCLDIGGLTCDASVYTIQQNEPHMKLVQVCPAQGGKCGTVALYCRLHNHLSAVLGDVFAGLPESSIGHGSPLLADFEDELRRFDGNNLSKKRRLRIAIPGFRHERFDHMSGTIALDGHEIKKMLDSTLDHIKLILEDQISSAKKEKKGIVKTVILCGGGSLFPYFMSEIKNFCMNHDTGPKEVLRPEEPQSVVATGALISGLKQRVLGRRKCRNCYGVKMHQKFEPGKWKATDVFNCEYGDKRLNGFMKWHVRKGDVIDMSKQGIGATIAGYTRIDFADLDNETEFEIVIYSYSGDDDPPDRVEAPGVRRVGSCFVTPSNMSAANLKKLKKTEKHEHATTLKMKVVQLVNVESGLIEFEARVNNTTIGRYSLSYDATAPV